MKIAIHEARLGDRTLLGEIIEIRHEPGKGKGGGLAVTLVIDRRSHHQVGDLDEIITLPDTRLFCPNPNHMIEVQR